jgi:hypothetical protein
MPLFRRHDRDGRRVVAVLVAMAAHVERNCPDDLFPPATTDRLEDAADELLADGPVSFETAMVVRRILESVRARRPDRDLDDLLA